MNLEAIEQTLMQVGYLTGSLDHIFGAWAPICEVLGALWLHFEVRWYHFTVSAGKSILRLMAIFWALLELPTFICC